MAVDPTRRAALIRTCRSYAAANHGELPYVSIEQFFDGNDDLGSILCNLELDSLGEIRERLERVRAHPDVYSLLVHVNETMEEDPECWPFSEQVLVITSLNDDDEVADLFGEEFRPDEVWELEDAPEELTHADPPRRGVICWWD